MIRGAGAVGTNAGEHVSSLVAHDRGGQHRRHGWTAAWALADTFVMDPGTSTLGSDVRVRPRNRAPAHWHPSYAGPARLDEQTPFCSARTRMRSSGASRILLTEGELAGAQALECAAFGVGEWGVGRHRLGQAGGE